MDIDTTSYPSTNYNARPSGMRITALVLHSGEGTRASDLARLCDTSVPVNERVSAHYYVDRAGLVFQLVADAHRAWHAGESSYLGKTNWNDFSIGIETEHRDGQSWPPFQRQALADLCRMLISVYPIVRAQVVAHRWIAPGRKFDPTNWPDRELKAWIAALFVPIDPLKTHRIAGPAGQPARACSATMLLYYNANGAFSQFGYALSDETRDGDASYMTWERAIGKTSERYGVELALLREARERGWLP